MLDKDNELALLKPVVETTGSISTFPLPIVPLVAILVERLPEWCSEEIYKDPPVPGRRIEERILIRAPLPNSEGRKAGFREVSCVFLYFCTQRAVTIILPSH